MASDPGDEEAAPFLARKARGRVHVHAGPDRGYGERVRAYYLETWFDYRGLWMNPDNRSVHFGYWDEDTMSHAGAMHMNRATVRSLGIRPGDRVLVLLLADRWVSNPPTTRRRFRDAGPLRALAPGPTPAPTGVTQGQRAMTATASNAATESP